jgi:hypothetical protein
MHQKQPPANVAFSRVTAAALTVVAAQAWTAANASASPIIAGRNGRFMSNSFRGILL